MDDGRGDDGRQRVLERDGVCGLQYRIQIEPFGVQQVGALGDRFAENGQLLQLIAHVAPVGFRAGQHEHHRLLEAIERLKNNDNDIVVYTNRLRSVSGLFFLQSYRKFLSLVIHPVEQDVSSIFVTDDVLALDAV